MRRTVAVLALACVAVASALPASAREERPWREVPLPYLWPNAFINDIAPVSSTEVWIGGGQGRYCILSMWPNGCVFQSEGSPVARKWNGTAWVDHPIRDTPPNLGPIESVEAVPGEAWISHSSHEVNYLGRFDGTAFRAVATPEPHGFNIHAGPAGVWYKGVRLHRWNGTGWTETPMPDGYSGIAGAITSPGPDEAWGLGHSRTDPRNPALMRWDGTAWTAVADIPRQSQFDSIREVKARVSGEAWAIVDPAGDGPNLLLRWKDGSWSDQSPSFATQMFSLRVDGRGNLFAHGYASMNPLASGGLAYRDGVWVPYDPVPTSPVSIPGSDEQWVATASSPPKVLTNS